MVTGPLDGGRGHRSRLLGKRRRVVECQGAGDLTWRGTGDRPAHRDEQVEKAVVVEPGRRVAVTHGVVEPGRGLERQVERGARVHEAGELIAGGEQVGLKPAAPHLGSEPVVGQRRQRVPPSVDPRHLAEHPSADVGRGQGLDPIGGSLPG